METKHFELISELSHALSVLPDCHAVLMRIYNRDRAKYYAAAQACPEKRSPAITCGRAEHQIMALRAMGVLAAGDPKDIQQILRAADGKVYAALSALPERSTVNLDNYVHTITPDENPDTFYARSVVAMGICATRGLIAEPAETVKFVLQSIARRQEISARRKSKKAAGTVSLMKERLGTDHAAGITGLFDATTDAVREKLDRILWIINAEGLDSGIYTTGAMISPRDAEALCDGADPDETAMGAVLMLLCRAIRKDRDFCLDLYREDRNDRAAAADREAEAARLRAEAAEARAAAMADEITAITQKNAALEQKINTYTHDLDELYGLRSTIYGLSRDQDTPEQESETRPIPENAIAIGGHPSWAKALQDEAGIRVWPVGTTCPPQVIASASEVWIQAAYMDHSSYYAAIAAARRADVPVRYFSGTGVTRCRQDLIRK